ncbi:hypothetical protein KCP75_07665 [Salmonella enterica subsp. enterica]|nr:hypothetical protein KCP75_07665 [Salmonella enterica subsp. enterica]
MHLECPYGRGNTLQYFFDRLMRNLKSGDTATANVTLWEPDTRLRKPKRRWFQRGAARSCWGTGVRASRKSTALSVWYRQLECRTT